jgi:hypothetical protein
MKTIALRLIAFFVLTSAFTFNAAIAHGKNVAGPNGGRLITAVSPHAEFLVTAERRVQITFIGEDGKAVAPAGQSVVVTAGERSAPTKLTFKEVGGILLSDQTLPEGNNFPAVVQIKTTPDAKAVAARFNVNLSICSGCSKAEYACTCGH